MQSRQFKSSSQGSVRLADSIPFTDPASPSVGVDLGLGLNPAADYMGITANLCVMAYSSGFRAIAGSGVVHLPPQKGSQRVGRVEITGMSFLLRQEGAETSSKPSPRARSHRFQPTRRACHFPLPHYQ